MHTYEDVTKFFCIGFLYLRIAEANGMAKEAIEISSAVSQRLGLFPKTNVFLFKIAASLFCWDVGKKKQFWSSRQYFKFFL